MPSRTLNNVLAVVIIITFVLFVYSRIVGKSITKVLADIKEALGGK